MGQVLYATILNLDTEACQAESVDARKMRFSDALTGADRIIAAEINGLRDKALSYRKARPVWNIFAAPEYSFANPLNHDNHGVGDVRHLSEGAKTDIEVWLKGLSVQYPRTLLFPGSIAWKKSMTRDEGAFLQKKLAGNSMEYHQRGRLKRYYKQEFNNKQTRQEKAEQSIADNVSQFQDNNFDKKISGDMMYAGYNVYKDPVTGIMWYEADGHAAGNKFIQGKLRCTDPNRAKVFLDMEYPAPTGASKLNQLGGGAITHMARNTSLIYLNGKKLAKYNKAQDYHEVLDGNGDTVYVPGNSSPIFSVDGTVYGVEICIDHLFESLKTRLPPNKVPEIVVLMSAKVDFNPAYLPNPSAMVIHACSDQSWSFVGKGGVANAGVTKVSPNTITDYTVYRFEMA